MHTYVFQLVSFLQVFPLHDILLDYVTPTLGGEKC